MIPNYINSYIKEPEMPETTKRKMKFLELR